MTPNFFDTGSPFLNHPLLTEERTSDEVDHILQVTMLYPPAKVLDIGCGFGRHTLELAKRGINTIGFDPSAAMIASAQQRAAQQPADIQERATFVQSDAAGFLNTPFGANRFDAVVCLMTTLGQIGPNGESSQSVLKTAAQLLPSGGPLLIEIPQRDPAVEALKPHDRFGSDTHYTDITRTFDSDQSLITETFSLVTPDSTDNFLLQYRLFNMPDVTQLLESARFTVRDMFHGYSQATASQGSQTLVIHAVNSSDA